ncbi:MAG: CHAT domain-containing tetratricopeptide repeat protein [Bacteroidota bacterium]
MLRRKLSLVLLLWGGMILPAFSQIDHAPTHTSVLLEKGVQYLWYQQAPLALPLLKQARTQFPSALADIAWMDATLQAQDTVDFSDSYKQLDAWVLSGKFDQDTAALVWAICLEVALGRKTGQNDSDYLTLLKRGTYLHSTLPGHLLKAYLNKKLGEAYYLQGAYEEVQKQASILPKSHVGDRVDITSRALLVGTWLETQAFTGVPERIRAALKQARTQSLSYDQHVLVHWMEDKWRRSKHLLPIVPVDTLTTWDHDLRSMYRILHIQQNRKRGFLTEAKKDMEILRPILMRRLPSLYVEMGCWTEMAELYLDLGKYDSSAWAFKQGQRILTQGNFTSHLLQAELDVLASHVCWLTGDYERGEQILERAESILPERHPLYPRMFIRQSSIARRTGAISKAAGLVQKAMTSAQQQRMRYPDQEIWVSLHISSSNIHIAREEYEPALQDLNQAKTYLDSLPNGMPAELSLIYLNYGSIYQRLGQLAQGIVHYQKALDLLPASVVDKHPQASLTHSNMALGYQIQQDFDRAFYHAKKCMEIEENVSAPGSISRVDAYNLVGFLFGEIGQFDSAEVYIMHALEALFPRVDVQKDLSQLADPENFRLTDIRTILTCFTKLGEASILKENVEAKKARIPYKILITWMDMIQTRIGYEDPIISLIDEFWMSFYALQYIDFVVYQQTGDLYYLEEAFAYADKSKSLLLRQGIQTQQALSFASIPDQTLAEGRRLLQELNRAEQNRFNARVFQGVTSQELEKAWINARTAYQDWISYLEQAYPKYFQLKYDQQLIFPEDIRAMIQPQTLLIQYFWIGGPFMAYGCTQDSLVIHIDSVNVMLGQTLDEYLSLIHDGQLAENKAYDPALYQKLAQNGHELYQKLLHPILSQVDTAKYKEILIIPDGPLGYLPFSLLIDQPIDTASEVDYASLPYIGKKYTIWREYGASLLLQNHQKGGARNFYLGLAPNYQVGQPSARNMSRIFSSRFAPLQYNRDEVKKAHQLLGGRMLDGTKATEYELKKYIEDAQILHFATHTYIDDSLATFSGLVMEEDQQQEEDGFLNAFEVYRMNLDARLAVLSACQTGYGKWQRGEGIMSLARAFKYAGCDNIVMSLWQANDQATSEIMERFFELIRVGVPQAEALQRAKFDYLQAQDAHTFPHYWGTFVLVGNNDPVQVPLLAWPVERWYLLLAGMCILVLGVIYFRRKKRA